MKREQKPLKVVILRPPSEAVLEDAIRMLLAQAAKKEEAPALKVAGR